jgi:hypothetical protein
MSDKHTQGRLSFLANHVIAVNDQRWFMSILHNGEQWEPEQRENMRRLVACWNAAEGLSTESLESAGNAFNGWKLASYAMNDAKAQRDELLAALKEVAEIFGEDWREGSTQRRLGDRARAAIAKAEASK